MTSSSRAGEIWESRLLELCRGNLRRTLRCACEPAGPRARFSQGDRLVFCSNDYLGLANHPAVREAFCEAAARWGVGAGASRLVSGNTVPHNALETETAKLVSKEDAVLFVSGYQANVSALSCLVSEGDGIFSDELVHASLIDGARLSKAAVHIYRHGDIADLERLLTAHADYGIRLIVTDSIFSMDGDAARLPDIVDVASRRGAAIYLDEAHAVGVMGAGGAGLAASLGVQNEIDVIIGTYSKAFGASGAFVAGTKAAAGLLRSRARGFLFSTGQPPALAEAILKSLEIASKADDLRDKLLLNIDTFRRGAAECRLPVQDSKTAIQPVMTFSNERTMAVSEHLWNNGFFVQGIRPPTVKPGEARLRVTLSAAHTTSDILRLTEAIRVALDEVPL